MFILLFKSSLCQSFFFIVPWYKQHTVFIFFPRDIVLGVYIYVNTTRITIFPAMSSVYLLQPRPFKLRGAALGQSFCSGASNKVVPLCAPPLPSSPSPSLSAQNVYCLPCLTTHWTVFFRKRRTSAAYILACRTARSTVRLNRRMPLAWPPVYFIIFLYYRVW